MPLKIGAQNKVEFIKVKINLLSSSIGISSSYSLISSINSSIEPPLPIQGEEVQSE